MRINKKLVRILAALLALAMIAGFIPQLFAFL